MLLENTLNPVFLEDLITTCATNDTLATLFTPVFVGLSSRFRSVAQLGSGASTWFPLFAALLQLVSNKHLAGLLPTLKAFNPEVPPKTLESLSLLGPFFSRLTVFPDTDPTVASNLFASSGIGVGQGEVDEQGVEWRGRNAGEIKMAWQNLRGVLGTLEVG